MKPTFYFVFILFVATLFIVCFYPHKTIAMQSLLQGRQVDTIKQKGWYSCILNIQTKKAHRVKYIEIYPDNKQSAHQVYSKRGQGLYFLPGDNQFSFYTPSDGAQFQSSINSQVQKVLIDEIMHHEYLFDLSQLENGPIEIQVQLNGGAPFSVVCDYSINTPAPSKNIEQQIYWRLSYVSFSKSRTRCPQTKDRNSLSPESQIFSFENHIGEYPDDFQLPISLRYKKPFDSYMGVVAYGNKKRGRYQCTELVHRFFKTIYNVPTRIGLGLGHGKDLSFNLTRFANTHNPTLQMESQKTIPLKFVFIDNGCSSQLPVPGSSISFSKTKYGHVAIVRKVEMLTEEVALLHLFQQNGTYFLLEESRYLLVKDSKGHWRGRHVVGWSIPFKTQL